MNVIHCFFQGDQYEGRSSLARELDILESEDTSKLPLLAQLVKKSSGEDGRRKRLPSGAEVCKKTSLTCVTTN